MADISDTLAALSEAANWLRECSDWLLSNDLDMTCPMQTDPLDLAETLEAISTGQLVPVPSVEAVARAIEAVYAKDMTAQAEASGGMLDYIRSPSDWEDWIPEATAAIAAMQEGRDG